MPKLRKEMDYGSRQWSCDLINIKLKENLGQRSSRQGHHPAGESPAVPIARLRHVAMPQLMVEIIMDI